MVEYLGSWLCHLSVDAALLSAATVFTGHVLGKMAILSTLDVQAQEGCRSCRVCVCVCVCQLQL